jgi:hypothetical protein
MQGRRACHIEQKAMELRQMANGEDDPEYLRFLTRYTDTWARATMQKWWELGDFLWVEYTRGGAGLPMEACPPDERGRAVTAAPTLADP